MNMRIDQNGEPIPPTTDGPHCDREPMDSPVVISGPATFRDFAALARAATSCPHCGKQRFAMNVAGRHQRFRSTDTDLCTCTGQQAAAP